MGRVRKASHINRLLKLSSKAELSRIQIYEAALQIIALKGFEKSTVRAIAKKSGLSIGLVHKHIGQRIKLVKALTDFVSMKAYLFLTNPPEEMNPKEKIIYNCEQNLRFFLAHPHYGRFFILMYCIF
jgi:AcrR family transcriptional regulator